MSREEFMKQLEYLLQDIKEEDKEDALQYYRDYLEDAGPEKEEQVIREFGSPERIAAIVRAGINGGIEDGGEFTDAGYEDERFRDPNCQLQKRFDLPEEKTSGGKGKKTEKEQKVNPTVKFILTILLIIVIAPMLFHMGTGALTTLFGIVFGSCMIFIGIGILAIISILGGIVLLVMGLVAMFGTFSIGLMFAGFGLFCIGLGGFSLLLSIWFYGTAVPWVFRKAVNLFDGIFHRERGKNV